MILLRKIFQKNNTKKYMKKNGLSFLKMIILLLDLFYGQTMTRIKNMDNNKTVSTSYQPVCFFSLPVPKNSCTIYNCFDLYLKDELLNLKLDNDDEETAVTKSVSITKFPHVLIVTLNRFDSLNNKINSYVEIPEVLDMSKYSKSKNIYDL